MLCEKSDDDGKMTSDEYPDAIREPCKEKTLRFEFIGHWSMRHNLNFHGYSLFFFYF